MSKKVKNKVDKKKKKKDKKSKPKKPLSLFGLFLSIIKGIIKSIPKMWKSILIRSVISFLVVTGFSFYTIAMKNEGVGAVRFASGTFWGDVINTGGNEAAFNTMCFVATYALTLIFSRIRTGGVKKFFKDIFGTLPWTKKCITGSRNFVGQVMFFTLALIMFLGIFTKNNLLFITLSITLFFEYASQDKGLISVVALAAWNDFHRVFKRKKGVQPLNMQYVGVINLSMLLGMIILALIPVNRARYFSIILIILFVTLAVLLTYNKISKKTVKSTMLFITFALITQKFTGVVFADNGGWSEGGRSVTTYVGSAGSVGVFITSAVSGIFSVAGGLLGVAIGGLTGSTDLAGNWNYGAEMGSALGEDIAYVGIETVVGIKDLTVDLFTDRSLINATMDNINEEMTDFFDKGFQLSEEVSDWVDENVTTEVVIDTAEGMVKDINGLISGEYAADWIKEELQEFYNDPEKYVNNAIAVIEQGGTLAGEASVAVERFLDNMRNNPRAAYEIIKAISPADSIKNIIDPNKGLGERLINVPFAAADVAEMLVGFGLVNVATEVAEQGVKLGVKTAIRETAEEAGQRMGQEIAEEAGQRVSQEIAEETGQRIGQEIAEEGGQRLGQEAAEEVGQRTTQEIAEESGQRAAQETAEEAGQRATQEAAEESGQRATQEAAEESGQRATQEAAEGSGQRATQEAAEESGQRATQEAAEESGQRATQEAAEESGQRATQEAAEESGQRATQEAAEESGQRATQEAAEESGQRATQEAAEESGQRATQEAAEESGQRATQEATEESGQRATQEVTEETGQRTSQEATEEAGQGVAKDNYDGPELEQGPDYTRQQGPADTNWMTDNSRKSVQSVADEMGVQVHVRPGNPASRKWLDAGEAVPKPQIIKSKTIKDIDRYIGAPDGSEGLVGYFKPEMPDQGNLSDELYDQIKKRFDSREIEFDKYSKRMRDLEQSGMVKVNDGIVSMAVKDPDTGEIIYKRVAGDVDLFDVTNFDGSPLPQNVKDMAIDKLQRIDTSNVEHRDLLSWDEIENYQETYGHKWESIEDQFQGNDFNLDAKNDMISDAATDEGLITFNPTEGTTWNKYNHPPTKK